MRLLNDNKVKITLRNFLKINILNGISFIEDKYSRRKQLKFFNKDINLNLFPTFIFIRLLILKS